MDPVLPCNWDKFALFENPQCQLTDIMGLLLVSLVIMVGMIPMSFIMFTIHKDFLQKQQVSSRNKLLLAMIFSIVFYTILIFTGITKKSFESPQEFYIDMVIYALTQHRITAHCWFTSCLSLFYFIKIVNFRSHCLALMKTKIDVAMTWILLVVELLSFCSIFLAAFLGVIPVEPSMNASILSHTNNIYTIGHNTVTCLSVITYISYLTMIVSTTFTMVSLKLHIHNLARSLGPSANDQLKAHHGVVKTIKHLLIFYIMAVLVNTIFISVDSAQYPFGTQIRIMIQLVFIPVQFSLIINGDPKLREKWVNLYNKICTTLHSLLQG